MTKYFRSNIFLSKAWFQIKMEKKEDRPRNIKHSTYLLSMKPKDSMPMIRFTLSISYEKFF